MAGTKPFQWKHLMQLRTHTDISDSDHKNISWQFISDKVKSSRNAWKACKKRSDSIWQTFLLDRADLMAQKLRTSQEKALHAILRAEHSRKAYKHIRLLIEKENKPLTQVDILSSPTDPTSPHTTITTKDDIETHILQRTPPFSTIFTNPIYVSSHSMYCSWQWTLWWTIRSDFFRAIHNVWERPTQS